jgi:hypothetical protein
MRSVLWCMIVSALAGLTAACANGGTPVSPSPQAPPAFQLHATANFTFHYTSLDAATIADTAMRVEAEYARIVGDLQPASMSRITVFLYADVNALQAAVRPTAGTLPSFAQGLVTGSATVHVLSPNLSSTWPYAQGVSAIVHEFAHCVSLHVNTSFANNPRWLWESVAIYEAGQFVDPRTVAWVATGQVPALARLNGFDNSDVYDVGFVMAEFIVSGWGRDGLIALVRNNGNVAAVTGMTDAAFMAAWSEFVRTRYGPRGLRG